MLILFVLSYFTCFVDIYRQLIVVIIAVRVLSFPVKCHKLVHVLIYQSFARSPWHCISVDSTLYNWIWFQLHSTLKNFRYLSFLTRGVYVFFIIAGWMLAYFKIYPQLTLSMHLHFIFLFCFKYSLALF